MMRVYQVLIIIALLLVVHQIEGNVLHGGKIPALALFAIVVIFLWVLYKLRCYIDKKNGLDE